MDEKFKKVLEIALLLVQMLDVVVPDESKTQAVIDLILSLLIKLKS